MIFQRRLVRLHLEGQQESIEGLWRRVWLPRSGHYVVEIAALVGENATHNLNGNKVRVPRERVIFMQELHG